LVIVIVNRNGHLKRVIVKSCVVSENYRASDLPTNDEQYAGCTLFWLVSMQRSVVTVGLCWSLCWHANVSGGCRVFTASSE
jgi:hypothetical protein